MYSIRLKPGTYPPPLGAGMYVAQSALPSELRFTLEIQTARTWESYQEAYSYVDENLYGSADVVKVVSMQSLLADINRIREHVATTGSSSPEPDDSKLYLYHLYRKSAFTLLEGHSLAEEWATEADISKINEEAIQYDLIWVRRDNLAQ